MKYTVRNTFDPTFRKEFDNLPAARRFVKELARDCHFKPGEFIDFAGRGQFLAFYSGINDQDDKYLSIHAITRGEIAQKIFDEVFMVKPL